MTFYFVSVIIVIIANFKETMPDKEVPKLKIELVETQITDESTLERIKQLAQHEIFSPIIQACLERTGQIVILGGFDLVLTNKELFFSVFPDGIIRAEISSDLDIGISTDMSDAGELCQEIQHRLSGKSMGDDFIKTKRHTSTKILVSCGPKIIGDIISLVKISDRLATTRRSVGSDTPGTSPLETYLLTNEVVQDMHALVIELHDGTLKARRIIASGSDTPIVRRNPDSIFTNGTFAKMVDAATTEADFLYLLREVHVMGIQAFRLLAKTAELGLFDTASLVDFCLETLALEDHAENLLFEKSKEIELSYEGNWMDERTTHNLFKRAQNLIRAFRADPYLVVEIMLKTPMMEVLDIWGQGIASRIGWRGGIYDDQLKIPVTMQKRELFMESFKIMAEALREIEPVSVSEIFSVLFFFTGVKDKQEALDLLYTFNWPYATPRQMYPFGMPYDANLFIYGWRRTKNFDPVVRELQVGERLDALVTALLPPQSKFFNDQGLLTVSEGRICFSDSVLNGAEPISEYPLQEVLALLLHNSTIEVRQAFVREIKTISHSFR